jgi:prevent-host-death family protein
MTDTQGSTVPVREFRAKLTHYLTRAQRGEITVITSNGIPVGALVPLDAARHMVRRAADGIRMISEREIAELEAVDPDAAAAVAAHDRKARQAAEQLPGPWPDLSGKPAAIGG